MAAHCINDVITTGADPLILLDYVAANRIDLEQVAELVEGAAEVCRAAGVALIGGETAELPGVYREDELDFAATCVGIVDRDAPDRRLGRARGRRRRRAAARPACTRTASRSSAACSRTRTTTAPTCSRRRGSTSTTSAACAARAHAFAHVTGGGIEGNLGRVVPDGLRAELDWDAWERPPVFDWLARHVAEDELRRVFNLGIGYCAVVPEADAGRARDREDRRARDRRARQRRGHEPAGAARRRPAGRGRRVEPRRRARARARAERAGVPAAVFELDDYATRDARDAAMADWLEEHGVELVVCAGYMHLLTAAFLDRFPAADRERPSVAAAGVPRRPRDRGGARGRRARDGRDGALVDEGLDTGPIVRQEPVPVEPRAHARSSASTPSSTGCCRRW